ncbi:MAG: hypothetical protein J7574_12590 [Flavobacterium sp.]|uniref:hypothetical protein n=1 Tax=Flavobacterium sp. TaxID=239 RepID=UPI001B2EE4F5|nr:hypothetical protein [Flavobacterium sp.]MBO9584990.1 hypothetical protein [Flavobacterium sp.]
METIKKIVLMCMFFIVNYIAGQNKNELTKEKEAFLIGMFNHFSGDLYIPEHPVLKNRLTFFLGGKQEMLKIFKESISLYAEETGFKYSFQQNDFLELYNLSSFNPFEKYYKIVDQNQFYDDSKNDKEYKVYSLVLNKSAFKENKVKLAFLVGAFLNSGKSVSDNELFYRGNPKYIDFVTRLLKDMKFSIIKIESPKKETAGALKTIFFKPTDEFKQILKNYNAMLTPKY